MSGVKFGVAQAFAERLNNSWSAQDLTMKEKIFELIKESILCLNEEWEIPELENPTSDTRLFGHHSSIDSLALVNLIAEVEERLNDSFGRDIIIADERVMSRTHSPFRQVSSLAEYIEILLNGDS